MKKPLLFISLSLLLAPIKYAAAQVRPAPRSAAAAPVQPCNTFSGRVMANDKPLAGVSVFVKGTSIILITNEEGFFTLPAQVTQFPTLSVSAAGYGPKNTPILPALP
ncbi:carboxypeptidase-like regulatory domain-containing protein [Hymenobacter sp. BRD67]|uniref:carboxypeptidase-like regulatory domain-containing protein n=1 Tax=Hymenobacter sp. BRD67 TaxID=2675877 RepID=UPI001563B880|nr:carboxypeptidase-like regulatory domain-containing protein [Hymenobacter sp. BRD67]QKG54034.1 carboxypeptidase-like regulatory domain-containing protein [Hymenobacter sp. BRD67]